MHGSKVEKALSNDSMCIKKKLIRMEIKEGYGCEEIRIIFNAMGGMQ